MPAVRAVVQICEASFTDMEECSWPMKSVPYPADLARRDDVDGGDDFDSERLGNFSKPLGPGFT
jgi:hypothetical protein